MNLPNKITFGRIISTIIFIIILSVNFPYKEAVSALVFIVIVLSDAVDGFIARKTNQITTLGKFIDPLADKLLISAALIFLIGHGLAPWMAYTIIAREFIVTGLRLIAISKNKIISASKLGKIKTILQVVGILALLLNLEFSYYFMLIATIFTIISGLDYLKKNIKLLE
ncbi:CDP-diacylglycerol--glycerol-3-phosphate 3-phosphatidyltransferase [Nanoarchaeota archaeon]